MVKTSGGGRPMHDNGNDFFKFLPSINEYAVFASLFLGLLKFCNFLSLKSDPETTGQNKMTPAHFAARYIML